jgi:hypothetical protein
MARVDPARAAFTVRCAIYTRKSSDERLEQEFGDCSQIAETLISPCRSFRAIGPARQAVELANTGRRDGGNASAEIQGP